ncbi:cytochrome P450 4d1 isoform X1 [Musca autumnalis]
MCIFCLTMLENEDIEWQTLLLIAATSISLLLTTIGAIVYLLKFKPKIDATRNLHSAPTLPIVGHAHYFIGVPAHLMLQRILSMGEGHRTLKVWLGTQLNIIFSHLTDIETVLGSMKHLQKAAQYQTLESWLREGLLISTGRKWFKRRKQLTSAFHFSILTDYVSVFDGTSCLMVDKLKRYILDTDNSQPFNFYEYISLCTLDVICETAMGVSVNAQTNVDSEYVRAVKTIAMVLHKRMFDILCRFDLTYRFTRYAREEKKALAVLHGFTEKVIIQRREELLKAQNQKGDEHLDDTGSKKKMAFLDILLQSEVDGKPLTNLDIREEVDTFMFEGHDTTSSAVTFCFYNLALYPECQQKCFEEIIQVLGKDKTKPVTFEDLNNLHYVDLCVKETLRMFPSVPLLGRKVTEECEINGKIIPAGTNIGISPLQLGRLEELFPEPNVFKPERFEAGYSTERLSPYAYIPFSAGPRNCIGQKFAMLEIKTIVANVLRHYVVECLANKEEELELIAELILRTKDPIMFKIKPRVY